MWGGVLLAPGAAGTGALSLFGEEVAQSPPREEL